MRAPPFATYLAATAMAVAVGCSASSDRDAGQGRDAVGSVQDTAPSVPPPDAGPAPDAPPLDAEPRPDAATSIDAPRPDDAPSIDAAPLDAPSLDAPRIADVPASDVPAMDFGPVEDTSGDYSGTPCSVRGTAGTCYDVAACASYGGVSTPGYCPGPADIQCCTAADDAGVVTPPDDVARVDAAPGTCPGDMVAVADFCMDRYEAPNVAGALPLAMQTGYDGENWCDARGKRLCTEAEWVRACEGTTGMDYPYGATYMYGTCDDDKTWISPDWTTLGTWPSAAAMAEAARLYQADPSGSRAGCVSQDGVMDLTGNVAEWVVSSDPHMYDHVMKGCYWAGCYGGSAPSCSFVNPAHPAGFRTYEGGFRCCYTPT